METNIDNLLVTLKACEDAREWAKGKTIDEVVTTCHRGDWLLWLAKKVDIDLRMLTLAKGHCAATVLHLMNDERSRNAVQAAIDFGEGKIAIEELNAFAYTAAAAYAYADAAYAAYAAYAAAYAAAAYADAADAAYAADAAAYAAAAYAYADAADAAAYASGNKAREDNQMKTADICRKHIGEEIKRIVNEKLK